MPGPYLFNCFYTMRSLAFLVIKLGISTIVCCQEADPCKYNRNAQAAVECVSKAPDTSARLAKWGFREFEFKPDFNFLYNTKPVKSCKIQVNSTAKFQWVFPMKKASAEFLAEQRLGGVAFPDSLRTLGNDELRMQFKFAASAEKKLRPSPAVLTEFKTAIFKQLAQGKNASTLTMPRGFLFPGESVVSAGVKAEQIGKGSLECGIAGLKISWLRKNVADAEHYNKFSGLEAPHFRSINGGIHFAAQWNCALGKYLKLEHSSRVFKALYPENLKSDIELRNSLVFMHTKSLQTTIRQSYVLNSSLGSSPDFSGEVVMGYVFLKKAGKR